MEGATGENGEPSCKEVADTTEVASVEECSKFPGEALELDAKKQMVGFFDGVICEVKNALPRTDDELVNMDLWSPMEIDQAAGKKLGVDSRILGFGNYDADAVTPVEIFGAFTEIDNATNCSSSRRKKTTDVGECIENRRLVVSSVYKKIVLPSQFPQKDEGQAGCIIEGWISHIVSPTEFYVVPRYNFLCGKTNFSPATVSQIMDACKLLSIFSEAKENDTRKPIRGSQLSGLLENVLKTQNESIYHLYQQIVSTLSLHMQNLKYEELRHLNYLIGEAVAVRTDILEGSGYWMRAVVLDVYYNEKRCEHAYRVQLLDIGRIEVVPWDLVTSLPEKFATVQPLAYKCSLGGVLPICGSFWSTSAINRFKELLENDQNGKFVEITILNPPNDKKCAWPSLIEADPYIVDVNVLGKDGKYISNVGFDLTNGTGDTTFAIPTGSVPWFTRVNLLYNGKFEPREWKVTS